MLQARGCLTQAYRRDVVEQFAHDLPALGLSALHRLQLDEHCIDLGHDAADGVFHAVHTALSIISHDHSITMY